MLRMARLHVPTDSVAEEVVQETWLAVLTGLDRFRAESSLRTWVYRILLNQAKTRGARDAGRCRSPASTPRRTEGPTVDPERFQGPATVPGRLAAVPRGVARALGAIPRGARRRGARPRRACRPAACGRRPARPRGHAAGRSRAARHLPRQPGCSCTAAAPSSGALERSTRACRQRGRWSPMRCTGFVELVTAYLEDQLVRGRRARGRSRRTWGSARAAMRYLGQFRVTISLLGQLPEESLSPAARTRCWTPSQTGTSTAGAPMIMRVLVHRVTDAGRLVMAGWTRGTGAGRRRRPDRARGRGVLPGGRPARRGRGGRRRVASRPWCVTSAPTWWCST